VVQVDADFVVHAELSIDWLLSSWHAYLLATFSIFLITLSIFLHASDSAESTLYSGHYRRKAFCSLAPRVCHFHV